MSDEPSSAEDESAPHLTDGPVYDRAAVALGPFTTPPSDLFAHLHINPDGTTLRAEALPGRVVRDGAREWMVGALDEASVALGAEDMVVVTALAEQGVDVVQVVAGWIARAHSPAHEPPSSSA